MKVLHVTSWYPSQDAPFQGVFVQEHVRSARKAGCEVAVLVLRFGSSMKKFPSNMFEMSWRESTDETGFTVWEAGFHSPAHKLIHQAPRLQASLLRTREKGLRAFHPDLIHSHVIFPAGQVGDRLALRWRIPHVLTEHWSLSSNHLRQSARARTVAGRLEALMPVSRWLGEAWSPYLPADRIHVVPNVIDEERFPFRPTPNPDEGAVVRLLAVANWNRTRRVVKRPELILDAMEAIHRRTGRPMEIEMIGEGNLLPGLREQVKDYGIWVRFRGWRDKAYVAEALHRTHLFVHASLVETFSVVIAEALLTGTPVLASRVGAIPELVDEEVAVLVTNESQAWEEGLQRALFRLDRRRFDLEAWRTRNRKRFARETIGRRIISIYRNETG